MKAVRDMGIWEHLEKHSGGGTVDSELGKPALDHAEAFRMPENFLHCLIVIRHVHLGNNKTLTA